MNVKFKSYYGNGELLSFLKMLYKCWYILDETDKRRTG